MNTEHSPSAHSSLGGASLIRSTPEAKVTLDLSGIPAKAQHAISVWLSEKDQQSIVDALSAMARKVDKELHGTSCDGMPFNEDRAAEIIVIPAFDATAHQLMTPAMALRKVA